MKQYKDIIDSLVLTLPRVNQWWPKYFFHFTDIHNAVGIITEGIIYGRTEASERGLMQNDNASSAVIHITDDTAKSLGRLYFRPRTPTQYHNEGYKPESIRSAQINANCPVPVFFLLDSLQILDLPDVHFVEKGLGHYNAMSNLASGPEAYAHLNFAKIYHEGWFEKGSDITQYRHSEVVRYGGIPISPALKGIVCRSNAERETLLYLLRKQAPAQYELYKNCIFYHPHMNLFFRNGVFLENVSLSDEGFCFTLNDHSKRYRGTSDLNDVLFHFSANLIWFDDSGRAFDQNAGVAEPSYLYSDRVVWNFGKIKSNHATLQVQFDGNTVYENNFTFDNGSII